MNTYKYLQVAHFSPKNSPKVKNKGKNEMKKKYKKIKKQMQSKNNTHFPFDK